MSETPSRSPFPPPPSGDVPAELQAAAPRPPSGRGRPRRRWIPAIVIVIVMSATVFGGYVVAAAVPTPTGSAIEVGGLVRIQPVSGWEAAGTLQAPLGVHGEGLTRGSGNLAVYTAAFGGTPLQLADVYVEQLLGPHAVRYSQSELVAVQLNPSTVAVRFGYVGIFEGVSAPIEGEVTVLVSSEGTGVVYDGWAPEGLLQGSLGQIHAMQDDAVVQ